MRQEDDRLDRATISDLFATGVSTLLETAPIVM
jgi:hypothetical protein